MSADTQVIAGLPSGRRSRAYRAIVGIATEDPVLAEVIKTWQTRAGDDDDELEPAFGACPMLAFTPVNKPDGPITNVTSLVNMVIGIQIITVGWRVDTMMDLWDAVSEAYRLDRPYRAASVGQFLRCALLPDVSIQDIRLAEPAFYSWLPGESDKKSAGMQKGVGTIEFSFQRPR